MANIVQFSVDDTSPAIVYSPFGDTLSLPLNIAGWNPYFSDSGYASALGVQGNGTSYHLTSLDGASLTIVWTGTSIQLQGNVTNIASYTLTLDGKPPRELGANVSRNVLATISNLTNAEHTLTLTTRIPLSDPASSSIAFHRAIIASNMTSSTSPANRVFQLNYLNDSDVAFLGKWTFASDGTGASFHQSDSVGDRAMATFRGAAFVLQGTTSPQSGNYSVTIDNRTVSYSARSSFLARETLLHYSTGLDPNLTHTVTVTNQGGGTLALMEGGFGAYTSGDLPTTVINPAPATTFPKGTIAAFVLAGILACLLITAFLYFFFIYRPRKKFQPDRERWRTPYSLYHAPNKAEELGNVLVIAQGSAVREQDMADAMRMNQSHPNQRHTKQSRRESSKSSFSGWKREVENAVARDSLGIQFRHPNLYSEKYDDGTLQSNRDRTSSSRSPSIFRSAMFMTNVGRGSRDSRTGKRKNRNKGKESKRPPLPDVMLSDRTQTSTLGSLSYMTAPLDDLEPTTDEANSGAPPSYAASISHRHDSDSPPSVPRSVTQSSSMPTVLPSPKKGNSREAHPETPQTSSLTPPYPVRDLSKEDRGSLMDLSIDETPMAFNGPAMRQVIRSLSPRTSRANFSRHCTMGSIELASVPTSPTASPQQFEQPRRASRPLPVPPSPGLLTPSRSETQEAAGNESEPSSPNTEEAEIVAKSGPPRGSGTFGPQRPISSMDWSLPPLPVITPSSAPPGSTHFSKRVSMLIPHLGHVQGASRKQFRLTPASVASLPTLPVPFAESQETSVRDSFLDFTTSSDISTHSHSKDNADTSSLEDDTQRYSIPFQVHGGLPEDRSRWSSSNSGPDQDHGDDQDNDNGNSSRSSSQRKAPSVFTSLMPLTIPPAAQFLPPHGPLRFSTSQTSTRSDPVHVHPPLEYLESPTASIPMSSISASDINFRHSDSDDIAARSRPLIEGGSVRTSVSSSYPPTYPSVHITDSISHAERAPASPPPPPPPPPTPPPTGLSSPNFLVQRVLGLHSPASSVTAHPGHSRTGSSSASAFATPFTSSGRFESKESHLRQRQ